METSKEEIPVDSMKQITPEEYIKNLFATTNRAQRRERFKPWRFQNPTTILDKLMKFGKR
jgi:predicted FMN-binding regulatory protein PaiB